MRSLQDEIKQIQRDLFCPVCSRSFNLRDINVRSFAENSTVELSVVCQRGHFPVILLIPVTLKELAKAGPITEKEIRRAHKMIDQLESTLSQIIDSKE